MRALRHPVAWLREHPRHADAALAAAVAVFGVLSELTGHEYVAEGVEVSESNVLSVLACVAAGAALALRRTRPTVALAVAAAITGVHGSLHYPSVGPPMATVFALYAVAAYDNRRTARIALVVTLAVVGVVLFTYQDAASPIDVAANFALFVVPWVLGDNLRHRRALVTELEERARRAEREREVEAARGAESERTRIARELHDVVAHSMGVMVVQAGAARRVVGGSPEQAEAALAAIESTGRDAMTEMRRLVGVLRQDGDAGALTPQPSLDRLAELVDRCREAGLDVALHVAGDVRPLPAGVELAAYRIVQEALTNASRHAGPARVRVALTYEPRAVEVRVTDDGRGASAALRRAGEGDVAEGRHGLVGMRERVDLYGGTMRAGPRAGGGFEVHARLPLEVTVDEG